jgi:hypothetical protein
MKRYLECYKPARRDQKMQVCQVGQRQQDQEALNEQERRNHHWQSKPLLAPLDNRR